jgi:hypothetical protein
MLEHFMQTPSPTRRLFRTRLFVWVESGMCKNRVKVPRSLKPESSHLTKGIFMEDKAPRSAPEQPEEPPTRSQPPKQGLFGGFADLPDAEKSPAPKDELR